MEVVNKQEIIKKFAGSEKDTGSTKVQIAILTAEIEHLTEHLKDHKKDNSTRRGLIAKVNRRRKLLDYLKRENAKDYDSIIKDLDIRR